MRDTGRRLLDAATAAFAEKGFHGTTTRDIATAAGVTPGAVYVHHKSKEELLYSISRTGHEGTLERALSSLEGSAGLPAAEQMRRLVYDFALWHANNHTRARIVNYDLSSLSPEHYQDVVVLRREIEAVFRSAIDRGRATGEFTVAETSMAALQILSMCIDIARWYREGGRWSADDVAAAYATSALRLLGA